MRVVPETRARLEELRNRIITPASPEFGCSGIVRQNSAAIGSASGAWFSANDPILIPFRTGYDCVVDQLGWFNGSAAGSNFDVGIYNTALTRLVSTGNNAGSGNSSWQFVNVTNTALPAGKYYLAMAVNATTANRIRNWNILALANLTAFAGVMTSATDAFPLPDPITNLVASTATLIPVCGISMRTP